MLIQFEVVHEETEVNSLALMLPVWEDGVNTSQRSQRQFQLSVGERRDN